MDALDPGARCEQHTGEVFPVRCRDCESEQLELGRTVAAEPWAPTNARERKFTMGLREGAELFANRRGGTPVHGAEGTEAASLENVSEEQQQVIEQTRKVAGGVAAGRATYAATHATHIASTERQLAADALADAIRRAGR